MPPTLESQKWTRPSSFSTTPGKRVFFTRDCLLARNFLSSPNAARGTTDPNGRTPPDILQFMFNKQTSRSQTGDKSMKSKILIATLLGCLAWQQGALSQTNTIATNPAATDGVVPTNQPAAVTTPPVTPAAAPRKAPAVSSGDATRRRSPGSARRQHNGNCRHDQQQSNRRRHPNPAAGAGKHTLDSFQDVPITTAIENLARQAGINYLIDPKIGLRSARPRAGRSNPNPPCPSAGKMSPPSRPSRHCSTTTVCNSFPTTRARSPASPPRIPWPNCRWSPRVIQLKFSSTSNMVDSIQASLTDKRSKVLPDSRTSQMVVVATENEQEAVDALVNQLDKPTRQVLIEPNWSRFPATPPHRKALIGPARLAAQHLAFGNGFMSGTTDAKIPGTAGTMPDGAAVARPVPARRPL